MAGSADYVKPPDDLSEVLPSPRLGGAVGRFASDACRLDAHDLCHDEPCGCRCHERR